MLQKLSFILLSFVLISLSLSAQSGLPGYILTEKGDTLKGTIADGTDYKNNRSIKFKENSASEFTVYTPSQIKGYGINNEKFYATREIKGQEQSVKLFFLREVLKASNSLYMMIDEEGKPAFIIEKSNGEVLLLLQKYVKGMLTTYLSDCPSLHIKVDPYNYTVSSMTKLITDYNACKDPNSKVSIVTKSEKSSLSFGVKAGIQQTKFRYTQPGDLFYKRDFEARMGWMAGGFARLTYRDRLHFQAELFLHNRTGEMKEIQGSNWNLKMNLTYLELPLLLRYDLTKSSLRPYLTAGTGLMHIVGRNISSTYWNKDAINTYFPKVNHIAQNFMAGAGISKKLTSGKRIEFELRMDHATGGIRRMNYPPQQTMYQFITSFSF